MLQSLMTVAVIRRAMETDDIVTLELADPAGGDLPPFSAGAHIDVEVQPGLIRQYSLCNNPNERHVYVIGVLKDPASRGGSAGVHDIPQGAQIRISEPRNHFELDHTAARTLLLAGGIGVTPILCMAERLANIGADFEMHYATRSRAKTAFYDRITGSSFAGKVHIHHDDGPGAQKLDIAAVLGAADAGTHLYVCGPGGFIDWVLGAAKAAGYPEAQVHREYFNVDPDQFAPGDAFQIKLASTGAVYDIPADRSIVEVLNDVGIELPISCAQGVCGTCLTRVLEGVVDHRDFFLTEAEREKGDEFTPCCSRSKTPMLVLDL
jgi:vanillate O-demethylase ferredoxin subunit